MVVKEERKRREERKAQEMRKMCGSTKSIKKSLNKTTTIKRGKVTKEHKFQTASKSG